MCTYNEYISGRFWVFCSFLLGYECTKAIMELFYKVLIIPEFQITEQELNVLKKDAGSFVNERRVFESKINELTTKVTEITNINNQLIQVCKILNQFNLDSSLK